MANEVYVALPEEPGGPLEVLRERAGALESVTLPFRPSKGAGVIAIAPAARIAHFCLRLPARSDSEALQAAPFAIEDELAQPVEEVHLVLGPRQKGSGLRDIYAADRTLMAGWIRQLEEAGLTEARLVPEQALIDPGLSRIEFPGQILVRQDGRVIALSPRLPAQLQEVLLSAAPQSAERSANRLVWLAGRAREAQEVDLRRGAYAVRRKADTGLRAWGLAAGLGLAACLLWTASHYAEAARRAAAAEALRREAVQKYAGIFPGAPVPADMDGAARRLLAGAPPENDFSFHSASTALFLALAQTSGSRLDALRFDLASKHLEADVLIERSDDLDELTGALGAAGLSVSAAPDPAASGPEVRVKITLGVP